MLNHEPRTTNHEPRTTNHESRFTIHDSRITNHESRITNHESRFTKKTEPPLLEEFDELIKEARRQALDVGLTKAYIEVAVPLAPIHNLQAI